MYNLDKESIELESTLARRVLAAKDLRSFSDVLISLTSLKDAFPNIFHLLHIALTICVTMAQCERSFSSLKRIKTYLRSTMSEQRLQSLSVLSIERKVSKTLSLDKVIDRFASQDKKDRAYNLFLFLLLFHDYIVFRI